MPTAASATIARTIQPLNPRLVLVVVSTCSFFDASSWASPGAGAGGAGWAEAASPGAGCPLPGAGGAGLLSLGAAAAVPAAAAAAVWSWFTGSVREFRTSSFFCWNSFSFLAFAFDSVIRLFFVVVFVSLD